MAGKGDISNSGTLAGRISGADVSEEARGDLNNLGGTIDAVNASVLIPGSVQDEPIRGML